MSKLLFLNNSYNVLGLTTDATEKDIIRRAKEIANLLKINEHPGYPNDIFFGKTYAQNQALSMPDGTYWTIKSS